MLGKSTFRIACCYNNESNLETKLMQIKKENNFL